MAITFHAPKGSKQVGELLYKDTFVYDGDIYMRVSTQKCPKGNVNTKEKVAVVKLRTGYLSMFQRSTWVRPVEIQAVVKEIEG